MLIYRFYSVIYVRRFYINFEYYGCFGDVGWLMVVDLDLLDCCGWEINLFFL